MEDFKVSVIDEQFPKKAGESCIYRSTLISPDEALISCSVVGIDTIKKQFIESIDKFGDEPFLGNREIIESADGTITYGKYVFRSYNEIHKDIIGLAKSLTIKFKYELLSIKIWTLKFKFLLKAKSKISYFCCSSGVKLT